MANQPSRDDETQVVRPEERPARTAVMPGGDAPTRSVGAHEIAELPAFSIRQADEADSAGILRCLAMAFEVYRNDYTREAFEDTVLTQETLHQRLAAMSVFIAITGAEETIGTIAYRLADGEAGHLRGMAVLPDWHGRGVAEQLLKVVERDLRRLGCSRLSLDTTPPLRRAVSFYEKSGFRLSGKVTAYFGMALREYVKRL
jgi:GNAT superfamily N-acetyltransferase